MKLFFAIGLATIMLWLTHCSTTGGGTKSSAPRATSAQVREFRDAENLYKAHKTQPAFKKFQVFAQRYPEIDLTYTAEYYMGQIYFDSGDYTHAIQHWMAVVDGEYASSYYDRCLVGAARSQALLGNTGDALSLLGRLQVHEGTDITLATQGYMLASKLHLQKGENLPALRNLMTVAEIQRNPNEKQRQVNHVVEMINTNLSQKDLEELLSNADFKSFNMVAHFRLGALYFNQKDFPSARKQFGAIVGEFPNTEYARKALQFINSIDSQQTTDTEVVGAVLPLSGKYAQLGYKTLRGIQLGLGIFDKHGSNVKLAIIDSEGNPDAARRGVERLVSEDHAVAIIGDVISKTAQAAATKAQELGVPIVTLSQKAGLNDIGTYVFRNALTPEIQMRTLADLAIHSKGYKRFAILYPNDSYGTEYATAFWDYVNLYGGTVTAAQSYQSDETDFRQVIQRLVGTYYQEDRSKEYAFNLKTWTDAQGKKAGRDKPPKDLLKPVADFDAIFIPDSPKATGQIAAMLAYNDVDKIPLLGTNIWNTPQIIERGSKYVESAMFVDNFMADDSSASMKKFTADFQNQFSYKPDAFEAQGYDVATMIHQTLQNGGSSSRAVLRDHLAEASNLVGSTGIMHMSPQRELEKTLLPLTISKGQIVKFETGTQK